MPQPGARAHDDDLPARMRELEARIARLEQRLDAPVAAQTASSLPSPAGPAPVAWAALVAGVPALGVSMLGMAGAYVLRALTESRAVPQPLGVFAAAGYAFLWLLWAARAPSGRSAAAALYSLTAALVLAPLLWESTLRFHATSTGTAAVILLAFTLFALLISWRRNLLVVATIATLTAVLTAAALLAASHDVVPFTFLLLAVAAAVEISACLDHWLSERWIVAAAADLAVLLATWLATNARGLPEAYVPISHSALMAAQLALPGIYFPSALIRTLGRGSAFSIFETGQLAFAFFLAVGGGLRLSGDPRIPAAAAAVSLVCAAACYTAAVRVKGRAFQTYMTFAFLLAVTGTRAALPPASAAAAWSVVAIVCLALGPPAFRWHGAAYLWFGLAVSGALAEASGVLLGTAQGPGALLPLLGQTGVALLCFGLALHVEPGQPLRVMCAAAAFWPAAAIAAALLVDAGHGVLGGPASHAYGATLRTALLAAAAVALAAAGSLRPRLALAPLVYPVMILDAWRLLWIDLRQDHKAAVVLSLLAYGAALLLLSRFLAPRETAAR